jgi:NAD-dependent dihydropyrimidine dehydrogenase PreA subunit
MGLDLMEEINTYGVVKSPECINCLQCVAKCPKNTLDFVGKEL